MQKKAMGSCRIHRGNLIPYSKYLYSVATRPREDQAGRQSHRQRQREIKVDVRWEFEIGCNLCVMVSNVAAPPWRGEVFPKMGLSLKGLTHFDY